MLQLKCVRKPFFSVVTVEFLIGMKNIVCGRVVATKARFTNLICVSLNRKSTATTQLSNFSSQSKHNPPFCPKITVANFDSHQRLFEMAVSAKPAGKLAYFKI